MTVRLDFHFQFNSVDLQKYTKDKKNLKWPPCNNHVIVIPYIIILIAIACCFFYLMKD